MKTGMGMMSMREDMQEKMRENKASLERNLSIMNAATGESEQLAAIKDMINEMASQRIEMMDKMMDMQSKMGRMGAQAKKIFLLPIAAGLALMAGLCAVIKKTRTPGK